MLSRSRWNAECSVEKLMLLVDDVAVVSAINSEMCSGSSLRAVVEDVILLLNILLQVKK